MSHLLYEDFSAVSKKIQNLEISPVDVVQTCLNRIEKLNSQINAFITVLSDQAMREAVQAEKEIRAGKWRGPLHGIPIAFKDMYDTRDVRTTAAFQFFQDRVPQKDAAAVKALCDVGAIIVGKTNMHTLAMGTTSLESYFGPVRNPWNLDSIAGGSSGGSAAAVALGMCYATVDTDAIGSCRLPAACCGVVGYKCTWGRIDNSGILEGEEVDPLILKLATTGIMARELEAVRAVADVLARSARDSDGTEEKTILGKVANFGTDPSVVSDFDKASFVLKELGYSMVETMLPFDEDTDPSHIDKKRKTVERDLFGNADLLLLPTLATLVPTILQTNGNPQGLSAQNTYFSNFYGLPAISIPCGFDKNGLPLGLQIVGRPHQDNLVLKVAQEYQKATQWHLKHPNL